MATARPEGIHDIKQSWINFFQLVVTISGSRPVRIWLLPIKL
jgi:hypothetical protein